MKLYLTVLSLCVFASSTYAQTATTMDLGGGMSTTTIHKPGGRTINCTSITMGTITTTNCY